MSQNGNESKNISESHEGKGFNPSAIALAQLSFLIQYIQHLLHEVNRLSL